MTGLVVNFLWTVRPDGSRMDKVTGTDVFCSFPIFKHLHKENDFVSCFKKYRKILKKVVLGKRLHGILNLLAGNLEKYNKIPSIT